MRADQLRDLLALGLEPDKFHAVVAIMSRRSANAIRVERCKNKKAEAFPETFPGNVSEGHVLKSAVVLPFKEESKKERKITAPRGTRLPEGWEPSEETCEWARQETGWDDHTLSRHLDEFCDYWHSVAGAKATKLDWNKTFRNRIRDLVERKGYGVQKR